MCMNLREIKHNILSVGVPGVILNPWLLPLPLTAMPGTMGGFRKLPINSQKCEGHIESPIFMTVLKQLRHRARYCKLVTASDQFIMHHLCPSAMVAIAQNGKARNNKIYRLIRLFV